MRLVCKRPGAIALDGERQLIGRLGDERVAPVGEDHKGVQRVIAISAGAPDAEC